MNRLLGIILVLISTLAWADPEYTVYKANAWSGKPAPTILIAHGCDGMYRNPHYRFEAFKFAQWGYNTVVVDSFGPRGLDEDCTLPKKVLYSERKNELYATAQLVAKEPWHKGPFILVGYSHGAAAALHVSNDPQNTLIKLAVAYYPTCGPLAREGNPQAFANPNIPTLVFMGSEDRWTRAKPCEIILGQKSNRPELYTLTTYEGATHAFDMNFPTRVRHGHTLAFCSACTEDANTKFKQALDTLDESTTNTRTANTRMDKR